ncbi:MAG: hypothetical protein AB1813_15255 [Verrucomicrobiota bacterium]
MVKLGKVARLLQARRTELAGFLTEDPQGHHLPDYLSELAQHLEAQQASELYEPGTSNTSST